MTLLILYSLYNTLHYAPLIFPLNFISNKITPLPLIAAQSRIITANFLPTILELSLLHSVASPRRVPLISE